MKTAKIAEVFKSVQGEGVYLGQDQLFIRFFGCNLSCSYCDTRVLSFQEYSLGALIEEVENTQDIHSVCLTGGEPLLQADFIKDFLEAIRPLGFKIYLETNGTLCKELEAVLPLIDIVAMDFKLPSFTGAKDYWMQHEQFLSLALQKEVFVKMVIAKDVKVAEVARACDILLKTNARVPVVLQPNWQEYDEELLTKMIGIKKRFIAAGIEDVRILPQAHKYSGIR
ncbi:MAG: 7-carboxy-7-deazaguanine synthase QueE [Candidatus Omnitrophota bacterium]